MIVYRLCSNEEVKEILDSKSLATVGKTGKDLFAIQQRENVSNHNYFCENRYLHFFADKASIFYLNVGNNCICTYNIPDEILADGLGEGYYHDLVNYQRMVKVLEYAIDVSLLSFDWLERIEYVSDCLNTKDALVDNPITDNIKVLYNKQKIMTRERKLPN